MLNWRSESMFGQASLAHRRKRLIPSLLWLGVSAGLLCGPLLSASAGEVHIEHVTLRESSGGQWTASVTLRHADSGWDHYADGWRVIGADGKVLGTRTLYHPHVNEQPFTRDLSDIPLPSAAQEVFIEAHDNVHGWGAIRQRVPLHTDAGPGFNVIR